MRTADTWEARGIVGRDDVLGTLLRALEDVQRRGARGLWLIGEPGVGKTTLLGTTRRMAQNYRALSVAGVQLESQLRFSALDRLLSPLLGPSFDRGPVSKDASTQLITVSTETAGPEFAVATRILAAVAEEAEKRPVLVLIDDAQWIDESSLKALLFTLRRLREDHVAMLFASRVVDPTHPLRTAGLEEIWLGPLGIEAAREVVARHAPAAMKTSARERIVEMAGGIPLALVELASADEDLTVSDFTSRRAEGSVKYLVERLFDRRLQRLTSDAATATLLAALDDPEQLDAFARAGRLLALAPDAWDQAEQASILAIGAERVEFQHPLLRQAVLANAAGASRRAAHRALGEAFGARGDERRSIWHRAAATVGANEELATNLERAVAEPIARDSHISAARFLVRAAALSSAASDRARRLLLAAQRARYAGRVEWAGQLAAQARDASSEFSVHARADVLSGHLEAWRGSSAAAAQLFQGVAERTIDRDPELAAESLGFAAAVAIVAGDIPRAWAVCSQAAQIPADQLSESALIGVKESRAFVLALRGETESARPLLDEVVAWYQRQPSRSGVEYVVEPLVWREEFNRARRLLDELTLEARRLGNVALLVQALVLQADVGYRTGSWQAARLDASEAVELAQDADQEVILPYALATSAILDVMSGEEERAKDNAERARDLAREHGLWVVEESAGFALGLLDLNAGRLEQAVLRLKPLAAVTFAAGRREPAVTLWAADLIEALILLNRHDEAVRALNSLADQAHDDGGNWARGVVGRYQGALAAEADFERDFETAIEHHLAAAMPFELARTRLCYGERLRCAGRRIGARVQLRQALLTFEDLHALPWTERAVRELASSGEQLRRGTDFDRDELTPKERQIAQLVATGASTREVASDLFLSPKTIETHLTRIYRKLGVRSKSELAAIAADRSVLHPAQRAAR